MENYPKIIVLGKSNDEKGKNFEGFIFNFLKVLGYTDYEQLRLTGMQIDFKAREIFTNITIFGEAKAYKDKKVDSNAVRAMVSKAQGYKQKHDLDYVKPVVITTNLFSWEIEDAVKTEDNLRDILLIDGKSLILKLQQAKFIPSEDLLNHKITKFILFKLNERSILIYKKELYWLQKFEIEKGKPTSYCIFNKDGEYIRNFEFPEIKEQLPNDIKTLRYFDLDVSLKILENLITKPENTVENLSNDLRISLETIKWNIKYLNKQGKIIKISEDKNNIELISETEGFKNVFKRIYSIEDNNLLKNLYFSTYFKMSLTERLIDHAIRRFYIKNLIKEKIVQLIRLSSVFPSVLYFLLFHDVNNFKNTKKSLEKLKNSNSLDHDSNLFIYLTREIYQKILEDIFKKEKLIMEIKIHNKILEERISGTYMLLKDNKPFVEIRKDEFLFYRKAKGNIKPGMLISPTNKKAVINTIASYIHLKNYNKAIEDYEKLLLKSEFKDENVIYINLGVAYAFNGDYKKAVENYEKALEYNDNISLIYSNLIRAWYLNGLQFNHRIKNEKLLNFDKFSFKINSLFSFYKSNFYFDKLTKLNITQEENLVFEFENISEIGDKLKDFLEICINLDEYPVQYTSILNVYDFRSENEFLRYIYKNNIDFFESVSNEKSSIFFPEIWNSFANLFINMKEYEKALFFIEKSTHNLIQKDSNYYFIDTLGEILYYLGKYDESWIKFEQILNLDKDDIRVKYFFAETCWKAAKTAKKLGKIGKAKKLIQKAKDLCENHCVLNEKIKEEIKKYKV